MKKALLTFLTFITLILCVTAFASCGETSQFRYSWDEDTVNIIALEKCTDSKLVIPRSINNMPIIDVCMHSNRKTKQKYMDSVTDIILHDDIIRIYISGFTNLNYNEYKNGKYLGTLDNPYYAFIESIDSEASTINIHPDTKIFGYGAFRSMKNLESIVLPDETKHAGIVMFSGCRNLVSVILPENMKTLTEGMFKGCTALKNVTFRDGVENIHKFAFSGCSALESITIPDSVSTISMYAFNECTSLTKLTLGENIRIIGDGAFHYCTSLEDIEFPSSITKIGKYSFEKCINLKSIRFCGTMEKWNIVEANSPDWNSQSNIEYIYCSDGVIEITEEDR